MKKLSDVQLMTHLADKTEGAAVPMKECLATGQWSPFAGGAALGPQLTQQTDAEEGFRQTFAAKC